MFVFENPDIFDVEYPNIGVETGNDTVELYNRYLVKQVKLREIKAYSPFYMMVY